MGLGRVGSLTSVVSDTAPFVGACSTSAVTTFIPSVTSRSVRPQPIPVAAPVTTATLPSSRSMAADTKARPTTAIAPVAWRPVLVIAGLVVAVELAFASGYGYHRDELYFREAGHHLAWGYVDQPPITPLLGRLSIEVFGDTLRGLRVAPALLLGSVLVVGALVARELGGDRRAQVFSTAAIAGSGGILFLGHQLTTPLFDVLAWLIIVLLVLRLLRTGDPRWWPSVGLAIGIGLENKHLVLLLVTGLLVGFAPRGASTCCAPRGWRPGLASPSCSGCRTWCGRPTTAGPRSTSGSRLPRRREARTGRWRCPSSSCC